MMSFRRFHLNLTLMPVSIVPVQQYPIFNIFPKINIRDTAYKNNYELCTRTDDRSYEGFVMEYTTFPSTYRGCGLLYCWANDKFSSMHNRSTPNWINRVIIKDNVRGRAWTCLNYIYKYSHSMALAYQRSWWMDRRLNSY